MKKKIIVFAVVAVVAAVIAGIAFAWWTAADPAVGGNTVGTSEMGFAKDGLPLHISGLAPINDPSGTAGLTTTTAPSGDMASDANLATDGASVSYFYVENTGTTPVMYYASLSDGSITYVDPNGPALDVNSEDNLLAHLQLRISLCGTANPVGWVPTDSWADTFNSGGPYVVYAGPLATLWNGGPPAGPKVAEHSYPEQR